VLVKNSVFADSDSAFYLNAVPDPQGAKPMRIHADPDLDPHPDSAKILPSQKLYFDMKNIL
jgi:hypothetical protein